MPIVSKADTIAAAANKLTQALREETKSNIGTMEQQHLKQLTELFQTVAKTLNNKEAEKPSQTISNANTLAREDITNTNQVMNQQQRHRVEPHLQELTTIRTNTTEKVIASPTKANPSLNNISQEDNELENSNTSPAHKTRAKQAHRTLTQNVQ